MALTNPDKVINVETLSYFKSKTDARYAKQVPSGISQGTLLTVDSNGDIASSGKTATDISSIQGKIPAAASDTNKLVDTALMNSSISTSTATFRGTFNIVNDLHLAVDSTHGQIETALNALSLDQDKNDYVFVQVPVSSLEPLVIHVVSRYKFTGIGWMFEYDLNNSGFTQAQWDAINSAITSGLVTKLSALPSSSELTALLTGKQNVISDLATIRSGATAGATAYQKPSGGIPETDLASAVQASLDKADSAQQPATTLAGYGITDAYTKTEVNGLVDTPHQNYVTVSSYSLLPATGSSDTIYRVSNYDGSISQVDVTKYSEYAWNGSAYVFLCVKSQIGEIFDISVYNNNATYADLTAALGADGANVPADIRRGGMSVKFVQTSDNKYVQYFLVKNEWSNNVLDWQRYVCTTDSIFTIEFSTSNWDDLIFAPGTELKISLDEYSGSAPVYIFGMKSNGYDILADHMQVGDSVTFEYDESWTNIRLYKLDTNPITFTVDVAITSDIEKRLSNVEDSLSVLIGEPEEIKFSEDDYNNLVFPAGTPIDIKLLEQTGSGAVYIFGMISENPLVYDILADHMQVGDNVAFEYKENWTNIRLYKQDTQQIKFEVRPGALVPILSAEVQEHEQEISDLQQKVSSITDETSQNIQFSSIAYNNLVFEPGTKLKIKLLSYSGEQPVYIFGMKQLSPQVYDIIADHMQVGQTAEFIYDEAWLNVRLYKNDAQPIEFEVVFQGLIPVVQEEIKGESEEIQFSEGQYNNLVFPAGTPVSIKLLEHAVNGTVYIFGMISQNPLVYDTLAEDMQVGESVTFEYKENWTNIRLYQSNAGNIKFSVVSDGIDQKIDILNQKIENSGAGTVDPVDRLPSMSQNPLSRILREPGYGSIIHTWGIIGDSLSSGCTECRVKGTSGKIFLDRFEYSWGQRLFKLLGVEGFNFSYSGQQTKPWCLGWTNIQTTSVPPSTTTTPEDRIWDGELVGVTGQHGAKYNPKQGYIIALGVNDASRNEFPLGTISDINLNDYTQNGDSFYGYYAGIIQRVRSIAPDCFVFCVTRPGSGGSTTYDKAIRDIVELFDKCYCIDLANGVSYDSSFMSRYYLGGHMNAAGYEYTAYVMNTYIDWLIRNNFDDFKDAALVGTQYEIVP